MRLKKLIKELCFEESVRSKITLGADTRLHPESSWLQLLADINGAYPTTDDLTVKTWVTNPQSVRQWLGFEADVAHTEIDGSVVTSVKFRLGDGTSEFYWDGGAWSAAGASDWNTEEEIADNISDFPATERKIQVVINLKSTSTAATPLVTRIKILYASDIEFQEDLIYRSLVRLLRNEIRVKGRHVITLSSATDTIDLADTYPIETPYNIRSIDGVFNHTDDSEHWTDLFSSYNPTTKVITLSSTVAAGKVVWIDFLWEPEVAVTTSQDYSEVEKVPSLIIDDIGLIDAVERARPEYVINKSAGTGVKVPGPLQGDLDLVLHLITDKGVDQMRFADEVKRFFSNHPQLVSTGLDEEYDLWLFDEYDMTTAANRGDIHTGRMRAQIRNVLFFVRESEDIYPVEKFILSGDFDTIIQA